MSHYTWIHRLVRYGVRPLAATPVTPNHLTTLRLLTGLGAGGLFAVGGAAALTWGAGLFLLSMLLDRADGELARLSGKKSAFGQKYDLIADVVCNSLAFVGLGFGLKTGTLGPWAMPMGALSGLAIAATFYLLWRWEALTGKDAAPLGAVAGFDLDDALLLVPLLLWLGFAEYLLMAAAIAAPAFAVGFYWILLRNPQRQAGYHGAAKSDSGERR